MKARVIDHRKKRVKKKTKACKSKLQYSLDVGGKVGQATLSPGQLSRKETPPLQQAAGLDRAFGWW